MIGRVGHKMSRIYTLYLEYGAPPQGDDKMSNRSSGSSYAYIDDQMQYDGKSETEKRKK